MILIIYGYDVIDVKDYIALNIVNDAGGLLQFYRGIGADQLLIVNGYYRIYSR
jgi:hypothetical protein